MRGIERVLAAILLAGAVGGTAVFARHAGSDSDALPIHLASPPPGHLSAPNAVVVPVRVAPVPAARKAVPAQVALPIPAPQRRIVLPVVTPRPHLPAPAPRPAPVKPAAVAPAPA